MCYISPSPWQHDYELERLRQRVSQLEREREKARLRQRIHDLERGLPSPVIPYPMPLATPLRADDIAKLIKNGSVAVG